MKHPTFGYAPGRAAIFDLDRADAPLPEGWSRDPAVWGDEPTAEAISAGAIESNPPALAEPAKPEKRKR